MSHLHMQVPRTYMYFHLTRLFIGLFAFSHFNLSFAHQWACRVTNSEMHYSTDWAISWSHCECTREYAHVHVHVCVNTSNEICMWMCAHAFQAYFMIHTNTHTQTHVYTLINYMNLLFARPELSERVIYALLHFILNNSDFSCPGNTYSIGIYVHIYVYNCIWNIFC